MSAFPFAQLRIGQGFDVHAFAEGRPLMLGGIRVPHTRGLAGHSDADVLLHALTDAVLGALAWGDIGTWFPDSDQAYKNIDSKILFSRVWEKVRTEGWRLINADAVVLAQHPKLNPHMDEIRRSLAGLFDALPEQIGLKATTTEKLGFVGREEGMAAQAVVLLAKESR
jgi:2-C-methyl-D-erythritol 2,4-cyclodiphosphate synthase